MSQEDMEVVKDGRGFQKTENFQVMNPNEANFQTNGMSFPISLNLRSIPNSVSKSFGLP